MKKLNSANKLGIILILGNAMLLPIHMHFGTNGDYSVFSMMFGILLMFSKEG